MSKRSTIDFGIDLGTTNSAIAVLNGVVPEIIKDNDDLDITSSAVHISKHGQLRVGKRARQQQLSENADQDVYVEFKRLMGTDHVYRFRSAGCGKSPEDLSAEVLKSLCGNVQQRLGEQVSAAVITVPAAFEQRECAATKRAAELAGLRQCPLVQEPVAAALAYGFQLQADREYWLVYDFGGGTFDAALMKADDGMIDVVNHGGDNHLGGADIDWAIVERIVLPRMTREFNFPDLHRKSDRWRVAIARIKHAVEVAKIELSRSEKTYLSDCLVKDADGETVEIDFPIMRSEVVSIAQPIIMESVKICQRVLMEKDLAPSMISKIILVGGPTLAPYFREILSDQLEAPLDHSIDPLTVVARGAAVFASTQQLQRFSDQPVSRGVYRLELNYTPVAADEDFRVRGTVQSDGQELTGYTLNFANKATGWDSGRIPVKSEGTFRADLVAEPGMRNSFDITLADGHGKLHATDPDRLVYTIGTPFGDQPIINSLGVEIHNNEVSVLLEKGLPLPAKKTKVYRTSKSLKKGDSGEMLSIPIVEGENSKADRNRLQGILSVKGTQIRRDIPAGSEVEVTLMMDADRMVVAKAYITMLDEEFDVKFTNNGQTADATRLASDLREEKKRFGALTASSPYATATEELQARIDDLDDLVETAQGDPQAAKEAETRILELKAGIDAVEGEAELPNLTEQVRQALDELDAAISTPAQVSLDGGDFVQRSSDFRKRARDLRARVEQLIVERRADELTKKLEQINSLHVEILTSKPEFWVAMFMHAKEQRTAMKDRAMASQLISRGDACMQQDDYRQLQQVVVQLMDLLPREIQDSVQQRGYVRGGIALHG